ncbi:MAG: hypothetical protein U0411_05040 [Thermodesulfovibrionales bacterium]
MELDLKREQTLTRRIPSRDSTFSTGVITLGGAPVSGSLAVNETISFTPAKPGTLYLRAMYTGDNNFSESRSGNTAAALTVIP